MPLASLARNLLGATPTEADFEGDGAAVEPGPAQPVANPFGEVKGNGLQNAEVGNVRGKGGLLGNRFDFAVGGHLSFIPAVGQLP